MTQIKRIWEPVHDSAGRYWLEYIVDNRNFVKNGNCIKIDRIIKFRLRNDTQENKNIDLIFDDIASYRITNESYSHDSIELVASTEELKKIKHGWGFYLIEESSYIKLIEEETGIPATVYNFKHYRIVAMDDVIDIITNEEPKAELFIDNVLVQASDAGIKI